MSQQREVIAGIAHRARQVHAEATAAFNEATWPLFEHMAATGKVDAEIGLDDERLTSEQVFCDRLPQLIPLISAGLEMLGAVSVEEAFRVEASRLRAIGEAKYEFRTDPEIYFWSPLLWHCEYHIGILEAAAGEDLLLPPEESALRLLERILQASPKIMSLKGEIPSKEAAVYKEVEKHLQIAFPSFISNVTFHTPNKRYVAEYGVGALKAVIEYKLAKIKEDVPKRIDELCTDVRGYKPNSEWERFYAVIYQLDSWYTQEEIDVRVATLGFPKGWKVLVTHQGVGGAKSGRYATSTGQKTDESAAPANETAKTSP